MFNLFLGRYVLVLKKCLPGKWQAGKEERGRQRNATGALRCAWSRRIEGNKLVCKDQVIFFYVGPLMLIAGQRAAKLNPSWPPAIVPLCFIFHAS